MTNFENIIFRLFDNKSDTQFLILNIADHFNPDHDDEISIAKSINAAFLILLSGEQHSKFSEAHKFLTDFQKNEKWSDLVEFYLNGIELIKEELNQKIETDSNFEQKITELDEVLANNHQADSYYSTIDKIWNVFFPEGRLLLNPENRPGKVTELREKRKINVISSNQSPVTDPASQVLFTSNVLLTTPLASMEIENLSISHHLKHSLNEIVKEEQMYWYDHPIPIGIEPAKNEVLYGLAGLSKMLDYEINHGNAEKSKSLNCVLSVSVTHTGLHKIAKEYLKDELNKSGTNNNLNLYLFTEDDTTNLVNDILIPIAKEYMAVDPTKLKLLKNIIGVDGEYGRHFSFLKAIAAIWHVFIDDNVQSTFKIDLDQVFPQKELVDQTGATVFEHFKTPLWGATGTDADGNEVLMGMLAGAVVNESDIDESIFYPDVRFPENDELSPDQFIFYSQLPQALSTEAEMIPEKKSNQSNQQNEASRRVHVLGGMSGILVSALRKYRPFTPTFIGRAEDQAYALSVLFGKKPYLRFLHKSGLIMRHDKQAFVGEVLEAAETSKMIGDYTRILLYSYYAKALPFGVDKIKDQVDPFTGCFISHIPLTVVYLRFVLKAATFFENSKNKHFEKGIEFLKSGSRRLLKLIKQLNENPNLLKEKYQQEKTAWDLFYDILDIAENKFKENDPFLNELKNKTLKIIANCKI